MKFEWVERTCPLCGAPPADATVFAASNIDPAKLDEFAFASRKLPEYMHPRLLECAACGLLYGSPVLSVETLAGAYEEAAFDSGEEARYASATYAAHIRPLLPVLPRSGRALDIGTGDGAFLEQLVSLGFDASGVEPSRAPIAAAKPDIRRRIRHGLFRPEDFPPASFSLITCFQTLEHVSDPLALARGVRTLLEPGGAFVIAVHNRKALSAKLLGLKSPIFDVEHLQLFCPRTARGLLERAGYERARTRVLWNRYPLRYWLRLFPAPAAVKPRLLEWARRSPAGAVEIGIPAGNLIGTGFRGL